MNHDLEQAHERWPRFAVEASEAGFRTVHALPMRLRGNVLGALNLFHIEPGDMSSADVEAAQALADVATIALLQHRAALEAQLLNEQLNHALNSRVVIEQAKGMLAERQGARPRERLRGPAQPRAQPQPASRRRGTVDRRRLRSAAAALDPP